MKQTIEERVRSFAQGKERVFLYGPGKWGETMRKLLQLLGIKNFAGFLSTKRQDGMVSSIPPKDVVPPLGIHDGILFSFQGEQEQKLIAESLSCSYMLCRDLDIIQAQQFVLENARFFEELDREQPASKVIPHDIGKRILVIQLEVTFGDMVWSSAFLRELRRLVGWKTEIDLLMLPAMKNLMEYCPYINHKIFYDRKISSNRWDASMLATAKSYAKQHIQGYDAVFLPRRLPTGFFSTIDNINVLLAVFSSAPIRIGQISYVYDTDKYVAHIWEKYFTKIVLQERGRAEANCDCDLLRCIGVPLQDKDSHMECWLSKDDRRFASQQLGEILQAVPKEIIVVVGIVGSHRARCYSPQSYRWIFQQFPHIRFLILGGKDAEEAAREASLGCRNVCDFTCKTNLREAAALIEQSDVYLGSDTGLMHFAAAFGKPCVMLSHSLPDAPETYSCSPARTGPWLVSKRILRPEKALDGCQFICRAKRPHCINTIPKEKVLIAFNDILKEIGKSL